MRMVDIIEKKRDGLTLTQEEIKFWIEGVTNNTIPEYQTSTCQRLFQKEIDQHPDCFKTICI